MKKKCYTKYSYVSYFVLAIIMLLFSALPLAIETGEEVIVKATWSVMTFTLGAVLFIGAIHNMQYFYFEDNYLIVKSAFGTIVKLNTNESVAYIETLPTYSSWIVSIDQKWICIYDRSIAHNYLFRFKSGCGNKKKHKRIQICYSEENRAMIEQFVKIDVRKVF